MTATLEVAFELLPTRLCHPLPMNEDDSFGWTHIQTFLLSCADTANFTFPKAISEDFAGLIKFKARWSGAKFARISMTEIADEIRPPGRTVKEDLIYSSVVKARHRTAIKPKGTSGNDEIGALQAAIAECC